MSQVSKTLFGQLGALPANPILGLSTAFAAETNPNKIDLGVGIYRDEAGRTPVMAAVRVPPSACSTSQSTVSVCSPNASRSVDARNDRPMRRCISWVRPFSPDEPRSLAVLVKVALGSIEYSAVIHPCPVPLRNRGTPSSIVAAHSTLV